MTDHASLLRQIRTDARPYIEQALDLSEVFAGFRKLASENGLDWGVIKALIKAEIQDEREGGTVKVSRIIEKADFASAYADMLGLGSAKMNENNFSSEDIDPETGEITKPAQPATPVHRVRDGGLSHGDMGRPVLADPTNSEWDMRTVPPIPPSGALSPAPAAATGSDPRPDAILSPLTSNPATVSGPVGVSASPEECAVPIQQAGPHNGGDHVAAPEMLRTFAKDTVVFSAEGEGASALSPVSSADPGEIPAFLRRGKAA